MPDCSFCKKKMEKGTGKMFVYRDGSVLYFCSSKCDRNMMNLDRTARKMRWLTKKGKKASKKAGTAKK